MKWFGHRCARWREQICLQAAGALADREQRELQKHLRGCAECRNYFNEIQSVAAPLADWEENFTRVNPDDTVRQRWTKAILAGEAKPLWRPAKRWTPRLAVEAVWRELIWPCRRAWAGMAALWLVMWGVQFGFSGEEYRAGIARAATPTVAMVQAWQEQQRMLAELIPPAMDKPAAEPPRRRDARPRSERVAVQLLS